MPTIQAGAVVSVFCPVGGSVTVTPSAQARVAVDDRELGGSVSRVISAAETFTTDAGGRLLIEAIGNSVTYSDPPIGTAAQASSVQALVSTDGILTINSRDGLGRVTGYTDNSGTTYTVTYGSFGPATISGGGKTRTVTYTAAGLMNGYTAS